MPFPRSYPTNPPLCHSRARVVPGLTIVEEPHSQQTTVEDADETDEEQEEDEEDTEDNLPWTHSPFTAGQYTPPPTLEEATTQCWRYSKRVYRELLVSSKEADLERNVLTALESVPLDAIRR